MRRIAAQPGLGAPLPSGLARLRELGEAKFTELARTIALQQEGEHADVLNLVQSGAGKALMDEFSATVDALGAAIEEDLGRTTRRQDLLSRGLMLTVFAATICVIALGAVLLRDARRQFHLLAAREDSLRSLAATLEQRVAQRTEALAEMNQRFETALRAASIRVFTQDRGLAYTWVSHLANGPEPERFIGRTDADLLPPAQLEPVVRLKQATLQSGQPGRMELRAESNGAPRWYDISVAPLIMPNGEADGIIGSAIDITERKEQEARIRLLLREVTHRSKNLLAVIQALMRQTAARSTGLADFTTRFAARLHSLAGSHDLLVEQDWGHVELGALVRSQLAPYADLAGPQVALDGAAVHLRPEVAQHIGMALHELASNAARHGALSVPEGRVRVSWTEGSPAENLRRCRLQWVEEGGPSVALPRRHGFGRLMVERTVARAVDGTVSMHYAPGGVRWALEFPLAEAA
jgi:PAS domain S-box-containing protein